MTAASELGTSPLAPPELLRSVFRQQASSVAVITVPGPFGFTATSLTSASAQPPVVTFGIAESSSCWPAVAEAPYAGVHLLAENQRELAATFARSGADRFAPPTRWRPGPHGVPLLDGVLAWLVCRITGRVRAGDHRIVLAELVGGDPTDPGRPLLYHQGRYRTLDD